MEIHRIKVLSIGSYGEMAFSVAVSDFMHMHCTNDIFVLVDIVDISALV